jgi:hypothetical protein
MAGTLAAAAIATGLAVHLKVQGDEREAERAVTDVSRELLEDNTSIRQLLSAARLPEYAEAVGGAEELQKRTRISPAAYYNLACVYAVASEAALQDAGLTDAEREARANQYRGEAVRMLAEANRSGYFRSPDRYRHLAEDPELRALRGNPALTGMLEQLKEEWE